MRLTSKGIPERIDKKICKRAIKFYAQQLLSKRIYDSLEIHVEFIELSENEYAYCNAEDESNRIFLISVNKCLTAQQTLIALAHEMGHVKQYAKHELKDYVYGERIKFQDTIFEKASVGYWQSPWEKDARKIERKLYKSFLKSEENI
jgi:hypothetical protein